MKKKIFITLFLFSIIVSASAQWIQSFDKIGMYKVTISGFANDEQALYASRLITECNNVLIARINQDGEGNIFTEGEISFNEILEKLSVIPNIEIGERYTVKPSFDDYLETYNSYRRFPVDISRTLPPPAIINDNQKQSRAYSVLKSIWMEKYPENYQKIQPASAEDLSPEKIQKELELSNQKNN